MAGPANPIPPDLRAPTRPDDPGAPPLRLGQGEDVDEYIAIEGPDGPVIEDAPDGGWIVTVGEPYERPRLDGGFFDNLAEILPEAVMQKRVTDLLQLIEDDKKSRELRDKQYEEGIRRTGLGNDAPGGAQFQGASRVVHPMLTEACIDYESRIIKELWPPSGPVKPKILGTPTKEKAERAKRKTDYMNYQLTTLIEEARSVLETTLTQVPLGGSQFIWQYQDHRLKRARWRFISVDKVYIPFSAESFASAHRKTFSDTITDVEYKQRIAQGMYRELVLQAPAQASEDPSKTEQASQKVEGREPTSMNLDKSREIYVVAAVLEAGDDLCAHLDVEKEGDLYPYLITIDVTSKRCLAWYRDWEETDPTRAPIEHLFEIPFIPWRGALSIGFPQIIGGLSGAATGALRALLDSAHVASVPSGLILKGSGTSAQSRSPNPGEFQELERNLETDDIRKVVMPFAFQGPSAVLFQLLGFLVDAARGTVRTSLDESAINTNTNVPVGTQLARVEEGLVVFSAIHGRVHTAFNRILAGLHRLNRLYLPSSVRVDAAGREIMVKQSDFDGPMDIQPVSDPTIYSDQQRFAQIVGMEQSAVARPGLWNLREIEKEKLKLWKVADPDRFLVAPPEPHELNAVNENLAMAMGEPVVVFPEQDHLAHLQVLLDFMRSPILGSNPLIAPVYLPAALKHAAQHVVYYYAKRTNEIIKRAAGVDAAELMSNDDKVKAMFDQLLAITSQHAVPEVEQAVRGAIPVIQQAGALMKSMMPQPPIDPGMAAVHAAAMETARKSAADQTAGALNSAKNAILLQRNQITADNAATAAQTKITTTAMDNETAEDIATARLDRGLPSGFENGESLTE